MVLCTVGAGGGGGTAAEYLIEANATPDGGCAVNEAAWTRAGALYVPIVAALLAGLLRRPRPRQFAGMPAERVVGDDFRWWCWRS